jgi:hypothetical protein
VFIRGLDAFGALIRSTVDLGGRRALVLCRDAPVQTGRQRSVTERTRWPAVPATPREPVQKNNSLLTASQMVSKLCANSTKMNNSMIL